MKQVLIGLTLALVSLKVPAWTWQDLWTTPDQQAALLMKQDKPQLAKDKFQNKEWAGVANYKAEDYKKASSLFESNHTEQGYYNQGNALAHLQEYKKAIQAYDKALSINPKNEDASFNRKLVMDLLKKEQEKKQHQQNNNQQNKDEQNKDKQDKEQQNKDQQNKEQQDKDKQNKEQPNKDQQNKEQQNKEQQTK